MSELKIAKAIRIITLAPIMSLVMLSIVFLLKPDCFGNMTNYILLIVFLTVLPILAYPLQPVIPHYKNQGRVGQRHLAILMAVIGYVCGLIVALVLKNPKGVLFIYLTYLTSGLLILLFNKVIKIKASGHACGVAGPITILVYLLGWQSMWGVLTLPVVFWASLKIKRHKFSELVIGTMIAIGATVLSSMIVKI